MASGLRFDRVALRLIGDLRSGLSEHVPENRTMVVTVSAPIRLASKTVAKLVPELLAWSASGARRRFASTVCGNAIRAALIERDAEQYPAVVGLVHNRDIDPGELIDQLASARMRD